MFRSSPIRKKRASAHRVVGCSITLSKNKNSVLRGLTKGCGDGLLFISAGVVGFLGPLVGELDGKGIPLIPTKPAQPFQQSRFGSLLQDLMGWSLKPTPFSCFGQIGSDTDTKKPPSQFHFHSYSIFSIYACELIFLSAKNAGSEDATLKALMLNLSKGK